MADAITTKNITSVDEVQSVDNTDKVFVNDNGSFKQISVSNLMKQAPSGVTEETDPTVSEWAKQPTKPTYTASEVGALPVGTKIPTKTSDLTNDSGYLTQIPEEYVTETELGQKGYVIEDDIPEKLPSPGTLTFTGAVNDTYDGSANKTINIPTGGGEGGTSDYNVLANKPKLNGVEIAGNKTSTDYKIVSSEQGIENNGKFLGVGVDGNVTPVDKPTYTADEVGARPDTWTPSAEDVGALPNNTEIPSKTSDLENDSGFITNSDIPEKLPNPQKIIFTGAVTAEYDGSSQQMINIPTGGGSDPYTLPIMSSAQLGGGKAVEKTDEDVPVAVDPSTGQLFVPTYPENTAGGGGTVDPEQIKQAVNDYLEENPPSGMTAEEKAQLQKNTEDISQLSEEIANKTGTGLSTEAIDKLEEVGNYLAYTTADGGSKWTELIAILRNGSSGGGSGEAVPATGITLDKTTLSFMDSSSQTLIATVEPSNSTDSVTWETSDAGIATVSSGVVSPVSNGSCTITAKAGSYSASCEVTVNVSEEIVTLQSISATYTGGDVPVGTSVTSLTGITVTATYSDGSMSNVTGYALSGEIVEGENTIMVSYEGKTTTFTVVGYIEEAETTEPVYRLAEATTFDGMNTVDTGYALCENYKAFTVVVDFTSTTKSGSVFGCDKNTSYGVGVKCQSSYYWSAYWSTSTNKDVHNASNGVKYVITHEVNSNIAKAYYIYEDALTTQEFTVPECNYNSNMNFTNTVILGSGFTGIINDFKIYESVLSQEEINAYVGV